MHRAAAAGHFLSLITGSFIRELNALDSDSDTSEQKNIFTKYLKRFKKEITNDWYKNNSIWKETI